MAEKAGAGPKPRPYSSAVLTLSSDVLTSGLRMPSLYHPNISYNKPRSIYIFEPDSINIINLLQIYSTNPISIVIYYYYITIISLCQSSLMVFFIF